MSKAHLNLVPAYATDNESRSLHEDNEHRETTDAELFYDLFFVANLTVFTYVHDVSDLSSLQQYIAFFCILWFTWYSVALFDVRFSSIDCLTNRISKAFHFCFMIGFASVGPMFRVGEIEDDRHRPVIHYVRTLTLILMASRLVLALQYLQTMWRFRKHQTSRRSLMLLGCCYIMAAAIYLGLFFAFTNDPDSSAWIAWYVVGIMESLLATFMACTSKHLNSWILDLLPWLTPIITRFAIGKTHELSFKHTHLIQRMSLLTLIILGEGAISVAKQCQVVAETSTFTWNVVNIVNIACTVLILYFLYMIYFDWQRPESAAEETIESRSIRQRVWAFTHFFLHLFMALAVKGLKLGIMWSAAMTEVNSLNKLNQRWVAPGSRISDNILSEDDWHNVRDTWNQVLGDITVDQGYTSSSMADGLDTVNDIWRYQHALEYFTDLSNITNTNRAYELCNYTAYTSIFTIAGFSKNSLDYELEEYSIVDFDISHANWTVGVAGAERLQNTVEIVGKVHLTYIYYCVAIGMVVLLCTALGWLSQPTREGYHCVRLNYSGFVGLALCLLATNALRNGDLFAQSVAEPWLLPATMALLFSVVVVNNVKLTWHTDGTAVQRRPDTSYDDLLLRNMSQASGRPRESH